MWPQSPHPYNRGYTDQLRKGRKASHTVPAHPKGPSYDLHFTFTLIFIHTPKLAEGVARKGNSFPCGIIHLLSAPVPSWSPCIYSRAPSPWPNSPGPTWSPNPLHSSGPQLVLHPAPMQAGSAEGAECKGPPSDPSRAQFSLSAHSEALHLVPKSQACSQPSWEAAVIGSINQLN